MKNKLPEIKQKAVLFFFNLKTKISTPIVFPKNFTPLNIIPPSCLTNRSTVFNESYLDEGAQLLIFPKSF